MKQEEHFDLISDSMIGKTLTDIEFYNVNNQYFVPDPNGCWIVDTGIELTFDQEKFSFGWRSDSEFFDYESGPINLLIADLSPINLEAKNNDGIQNLIGGKIKTVNCKWDFYQEYDENFELKEDKNYIPVEMILTFENESVLHLACIDFGIMGGKVDNMIYNPQGQFLIGLNQTFDIREVEVQ